jgi:hypothetical protein
MAWLADELAALPLPTPGLLRRLGCDPGRVGHLVRVARAIVERDRFQLEECGLPVFVLAVCGEPDGTIEAVDPPMTIRRAPLLDLLAFSLAAPERWAMRWFWVPSSCSTTSPRRSACIERPSIGCNTAQAESSC